MGWEWERRRAKSATTDEIFTKTALRRREGGMRVGAT